MMVTKRHGGFDMKQRLLIADGIDSEVFNRKAKGYQKVIIDSSLNKELVKFVDEEVNGERVLRLVKDANSVDDNFDEEEYIIVTKEFGLMGKDKGVTADIEYLFCDNGIMVLTLKAGALLIKLEDKVLMPNVNYESKTSFSTDEIKWVDAEWLKGCKKSVSNGEYLLFVNDFKFRALVAGQVSVVAGSDSGLSSISFKPNKESFEDLSLGAFDIYLAQQKARAEAKEARNIMKKVVNSSSEYDFEDDDTSEFEDEDGDDDDYSDFDV